MDIDRSSPEWLERRAQADQVVQDNIGRFGQHLWMVNGEFTYTIGNHTLGLPELIMCGGSSQTCASLLNYLHVQQAKEGVKFETGVKNADLFNMPVRFVKCADWVKSQHTVQIGRYYGHDDYTVLQVVMSDRQGRLPDEQGYDPTLKQKNFGAPDADASDSWLWKN